MDKPNDVAPADVTETPADKVEETKEVQAEEIKDETTPTSDSKEDTKEDSKPNEEEKEAEKEEVKEETKDVPNEEVETLKAEIARLQAELQSATEKGQDDSVNEQLNTQKTLLQVQTNLVAEYEGVLNGIVDAKLADVPENVKGLIPQNVTLTEKLEWINKAEQSGIFKVSNPDVEIGKPLNPKNIQHNDTSKLTASSMLAMGYGNSKSIGRRK
jgi:hypothetical protein